MYPAISMLSLSSLLLFGCGSAPIEEYFDYFYTTKSTANEKHFKYILYLGEKGSREIPKADGADQAIRKELDPRNKSTDSRTSRRSKTAGTDQYMSLSFRMEEEAFKRLEKKLAIDHYCNKEPNYSVKEYTWLTFTIEGSC